MVLTSMATGQANATPIFKGSASMICPYGLAWDGRR